MKFEIPFNEDITRNQTKLNFDLVWDRIRKKNRTNTYVTIFLIVFGSLIIYGNGNIGYLLLIMGFFGIIASYRGKLIYQENKKKYVTSMNDEIEKYKTNNGSSIWEFDDKHFNYKDYKYDLKINWDGFTTFRIIENNLFLDLGNGLSYILGKDEVGEESFQNIIDFLETKLKRTSN